MEDLKVRLEEAMLELELAKSGDGTEEGGAGGASSAQVEQLEKQNNLLKEALVKVRPIKHFAFGSFAMVPTHAFLVGFYARGVISSAM